MKSGTLKISADLESPKAKINITANPNIKASVYIQYGESLSYSNHPTNPPRPFSRELNPGTYYIGAFGIDSDDKVWDTPNPIKINLSSGQTISKSIKMEKVESRLYVIKGEVDYFRNKGFGLTPQTSGVVKLMGVNASLEYLINNNLGNTNFEFGPLKLDDLNALGITGAKNLFQDPEDANFTLESDIVIERFRCTGASSHGPLTLNSLPGENKYDTECNIEE